MAQRLRFTPPTLEWRADERSGHRHHGPDNECCNPCESRCPAVVPLRDYKLIKPLTFESTFLIGDPRCDGGHMLAHQHCIEMRIRRRGECHIVLVMRPLRSSIAGGAVFTWPVEWWQLRDGLYEAEILIDGHHCLTVGLRQEGCTQALLMISSTVGLQCGIIPHCAAPVDDEPIIYEPGECNAGCK